MSLKFESWKPKNYSDEQFTKLLAAVPRGRRGELLVRILRLMKRRTEMRKLLPLFVLTLGLLVSPLAAQQPCPPWGCPKPAYGQGQPVQAPSAVVRATVLVIPGDGGSGSGVIVATGRSHGDQDVALVITNKHVCPSNKPAAVKSPQTGGDFGALWLCADEKADLAALLILDRGVTAVPIAAADPPAGTAVVQVGFPGGYGPNARQGHWYGYWGYAKKTGAATMRANIVTQDGDSGSGIFANGELCGLVWGGPDQGPQFTTAVARADVAEFVEKCRRRWLVGSGATPGKQPGVGVIEGPAPPAAKQPYFPPRDDHTAILATLAKIQADLDAIAKRPGIPGPPGKDGKDGLDGKPGLDGKDGKDGQVPDDWEKRLAAVEEKLRNAPKTPAFFEVVPRQPK